MDDEKKPLTEVFADTIKGIVDKGAEAAMRALNPEPIQDTKDSEQHTDAAATPAPLFPKKKRSNPKRINKRVAAKKESSTKKAKKKTFAKKTSRKSAKKASKKAMKKKKNKKKSKR
jgi:hypothetical protein